MEARKKAIKQVRGLVKCLEDSAAGVDSFLFIRDTLIELCQDYGVDVPSSLACPPDDKDCKPGDPGDPPPGGP